MGDDGEKLLEIQQSGHAPRSSSEVKDKVEKPKWHAKEPQMQYSQEEDRKDLADYECRQSCK